MSSPWSNSDAWQDDFEFSDAVDYLEQSEIITSEKKERLMLLKLQGKLSTEQQNHWRDFAIEELLNDLVLYVCWLVVILFIYGWLGT